MLRSAELIRPVLAGVAFVLATSPAWAQPTMDVQGFVSLGYTLSNGNNYFGQSTRSGGDMDYYETGLSAYSQMTENVSAAAQLVARKAGQTEAGTPTVDNAFLDIRVPGSEAGVRLGRVKNPLGLFNMSRDVLATRPSILMPGSVYQEGAGIRELYFSGDGIQLYQNWFNQLGNTQFIANFLAKNKGSRQMEKNLTGGNPAISNISLSIDNPLIVSVSHETEDGGQRYALSRVEYPISGNYLFSGIPINYQLLSRQWFLSARYNGEKISITNEWRVGEDVINATGSGTVTQKPIGAYVQVDYRFNSSWSGFTRYDWQNATSATTSSSSTSSGGDFVVGGIWRFARNWQFNAELHRINGQVLVPALDNPQGRTDRTDLLVMMLGYKF